VLRGNGKIHMYMTFSICSIHTVCMCVCECVCLFVFVCVKMFVGADGHRRDVGSRGRGECCRETVGYIYVCLTFYVYGIDLYYVCYVCVCARINSIDIYICMCVYVRV